MCVVRKAQHKKRQIAKCDRNVSGTALGVPLNNGGTLT
jgi:hypothetical protein